jgi:hypothetical protein
MAEPISPAIADLTAVDRQALLNLLRASQGILNSPAATRDSERALLRTFLQRAGVILERGETDGS